MFIRHLLEDYDEGEFFWVPIRIVDSADQL